MFLGRRGLRVFEPPAAWLQYDCIMKTGQLCVEWRNLSDAIPLALMSIDNFGSKIESEYIWQWQEQIIASFKQGIANDLIQLRTFINYSSKIKHSKFD